MAGEKLSMTAFMQLRRSRQMLEEARGLQERGQEEVALHLLQEAVSASEHSVEARVALAQAIWNQASGEESLSRVEELLNQAIAVAQKNTSSTETAFLPLATSKLLLLLCLEGRSEEAKRLLQREGYEYRLSSEVFLGDLVCKNEDSNAKLRESLLCVLDDALPEDMLRHLQECFSPSSAFWREHDYLSPKTGYFSYLHEIDRPACSNIEQIIHLLWKHAIARFPAAARAKKAEWWAHCRPHPSGHQLHFDSDDEGIGGVRNPIVTTVTYLSMGTGGCTLVTDQRVHDSELACKGWLVKPKENRYVVFDGSVLHGVIPGRSVSSDPKGRRITLMVAFWEDIKQRGTEADGPGASRAFPVAGATKFSWAEMMLERREEWEDVAAEPTITSLDIIPVSNVWEKVDEGDGDRGASYPAQRAGASGLPGYEACFQGF
mmetsp:Transcript_32864/g.73841  ORF Transcript_32864/g.73841 Transcript_32864/m.73841 type:complete len:433 (-) Transcript_32864:810-2108(-)